MEKSEGDETESDVMLQDVMNEAKLEGWPMLEMVETLAVLVREVETS